MCQSAKLEILENIGNIPNDLETSGRSGSDQSYWSNIVKYIYIYIYLYIYIYYNILYMFYLIEPPPDFAKGWLADPKVKGDPTLKVLLRPGCPGAREGQLQPTGVQRRLQTSLAPHILGGWLASWESQLIISLYVSLCMLYIYIFNIYI